MKNTFLERIYLVAVAASLIYLATCSAPYVRGIMISLIFLLEYFPNLRQSFPYVND